MTGGRNDTDDEQPADPPRKRSAWVRTSVLALVSLLALGYVVRDLSFAEAFTALRTIEWTWWVIVVGLLFSGVLMRAGRMQLLLSSERPTYRRQLAITAVGFLAINLAPFRLGEAVRPWLLSREGVPIGAGTGAVVVERALDLLVLFAMFFGVAFVVDVPGDIEVGGVDVIPVARKTVGVMIAVLLAGLLAVLFGGPALSGLLGKVPYVGSKLVGFVSSLRESLRSLSSSAGRLLGSICLSALIWLVSVLVTWVLLVAFDGLPRSFDAALTTTTVTIAGTLAIPTPGFFGPFEVCAQASLLLWGVNRTLAGTFAIAWHLCIFAFNVTLGFLFLLGYGMSFRELFRSGTTRP